MAISCGKTNKRSVNIWARVASRAAARSCLDYFSTISLASFRPVPRFCSSCEFSTLTQSLPPGSRLKVGDSESPQVSEHSKVSDDQCGRKLSLRHSCLGNAGRDTRWSRPRFCYVSCFGPLSSAKSPPTSALSGLTTSLQVNRAHPSYPRSLPLFLSLPTQPSFFFSHLDHQAPSQSDDVACASRPLSSACPRSDVVL